MSTTTQAQTARSGPARAPITVPGLAEMKRRGEPIVMVTAYDHPSAEVAELAGVDMVLVGDSAATVVLGYDSTVPVTLEEMVMLVSAVRRGLRTPLLVADLPFGSYEASDELAISSAQRFVKTAGADAVKLERGGTSVERARAIVQAGIPVVGHLGLTPQTATVLGGYRAQGRTADAAITLRRDARALQAAGCVALVLEAVPSAVTAELMGELSIPVIGIGAGPATDGQVLVFHDLLRMHDRHVGRFVKRYADIRAQMVAGVSEFAADVRSRGYPASEHGYSIDEDELARFRAAAPGPDDRD